jgi:spore germination cell wall hydrolase CwlJ-like protein
MSQVNADEQVDFRAPGVVYYNELDSESKKQVDCLARNIYFESVGEGVAGWLAVGMVTMNRVGHEYYPSTVCSVVHQKIKHTYQFSWVKFQDTMKIRMPTIYHEILAIATELYQSHHITYDLTGGALFFHSVSVNPGWSGVIKTKRIGRHIFYRSAKR